MSRRRDKRATAAVTPSPSKSAKVAADLGKYPHKQPKALPATHFHDMRPAWRIGMLEMVDPFGWHEIDRSTLERIRERLVRFESMTWGEVLVEGGRRNHSIAVTDICREAQKRLAELKQDDIDELLSLGLTGRGRIWGIRENHILKLLWWDPDHAICHSPRRHT